MNFPIHLLLDTVLMFPLIADTYDGSLLVQDENSTVLFNGTFPLTTPTIFLQNSLTDHLSIKFDPTLSIKEIEVFGGMFEFMYQISRTRQIITFLLKYQCHISVAQNLESI